jgi:hypothetical protein
MRSLRSRAMALVGISDHDTRFRRVMARLADAEREVLEEELRATINGPVTPRDQLMASHYAVHPSIIPPGVKVKESFISEAEFNRRVADRLSRWRSEDASREIDRATKRLTLIFYLFLVVAIAVLAFASR